MRHLHALIIATGLCVPSFALAAAPADQAQRPTAHAALQTPSHEVQVQKAGKAELQKAGESDRARYADKEAQSGEAKDYRGGDTVVIGASAATAILAVLLLIILI
jgi:hypothetical protein